MTKNNSFPSTGYSTHVIFANDHTRKTTVQDPTTTRTNNASHRLIPMDIRIYEIQIFDNTAALHSSKKAHINLFRGINK